MWPSMVDVMLPSMVELVYIVLSISFITIPQKAILKRDIAIIVHTINN